MEKDKDLFGAEKPPKEIKPKCYNCKHAGQQFKVHNLTHLHCEHPKWSEEDMKSGKISPWDTLCVFSETCNDHEFKPK